MSSTARASALMLAARIGLLGLGFGNTVLTARLLQPEGRGAYASIMAALTLFVLCVGALSSGVALSAAHDGEDARRRTTTGAIGIAFSLGLLPLLVLLAWRPGMDWYQPAIVAALSVPLVLFTNSVQFACIGYGRFGRVAVLQVIQPGLLVVFGGALMVGLRLGLMGAMVAWAASWLATALLGVHVLTGLGWQLRAAELPPWRARRLMGFGLGAAVYNTLTYFTNRSLLFLVQGIMGLNAAGVFSVAVTLAEPVNNLSVALSSAAYPRFVRQDQRARESKRFIQLAGVISLASAIAIMTLSLVLMVPIFGRAYRLAILPLPLLLLAYVVLSGRDIAALWYIHEQKSYALLIRLSFVSFLLTIGFALPLTLRLGMVGAATGAVAGGGALMVMLLVGLRRRGLRLSGLLMPDASTRMSVTSVVARYAPSSLVRGRRAPAAMQAESTSAEPAGELEGFE